MVKVKLGRKRKAECCIRGGWRDAASQQTDFARSQRMFPLCGASYVHAVTSPRCVAAKG